MEKEFVPYELAVKLKAIGFDEECFGYYHVNVGYTKGYAFCYFDKPKRFKDGFDLLAPTFSQAFRWFREEYKMNGYFSLLEDGKSFCYMIHEDISVVYGNRICSLPSKWLSHEEAELACLTKLIEIVETRTK